MLKRKIAVIKSNIVTIHNKFESMLKGARPAIIFELLQNRRQKTSVKTNDFYVSRR